MVNTIQDFFTLIIENIESISRFDIRPCPNYQYADHPPFRNSQIYMKDAHRAESNAKSIFQFLRFFTYIIYIIFHFMLFKNLKKIIVPKDAHCSETDFLGLIY